MQTLPATHFAQRSSPTMERGCTRTIYHVLPRGAQPPQNPPRDDLPIYTPKRKDVKNVLRKSSRTSSSTTITTTASTASSSNNHSGDPSSTYIPLHDHNDWNLPIGPGRDPLLDRLRYDISYPPLQNQLPSSNVEAEAHFGPLRKDTTRIQASWSDSGHTTRENTFSALFLSPSSSSSSSEAGHHDSVHRPQSQSPTYSHPRPLSYHLPSRVLNMGHVQSAISHSDLHSSVSHSTGPDLLKKSPSLSWWKRSFRISDKPGRKEENQRQLSRASSAPLSVEPRLQSRRPRTDNDSIALSSSVSESGHLFVISTEEMDTSSSRARRKLRKKPHSPSAFPAYLQPSALRANGSVHTIDQRPMTNSRQPLPTPPVRPLANVNGRLQHKHTLYDIGKDRSNGLAVTRSRRMHPDTRHQPHPTSAGYVHSPQEERSTLVIPDYRTTVAASHTASESPLTDMLPPLRVLSPLRIHIPSDTTAAPSSLLSGSARCKSAPDLTSKTSNRQSRNNVPTSPYPTSHEQSHESNSGLVQSPINDLSTNQLSAISPTRPSFLRTPSNRRWTLAVSETPEDELLEELERLRRVGWALGFQGELVKVNNEERGSPDLNSETESRADGNGGQMSYSTPGIGIKPSNVKWRKEEMEQWLAARKALLVCREIVRTERTYCEGLEMLQRGETLNAPPPLLLQYLPALIAASYAFIERLAEDPSTWGVSAAFLGNEEQLEAAFVAWSGVVGEFFGKSDNSGTRQEVRDSKPKGRKRRISLVFDRIPLVQSLTPIMEGSSKNTEPQNRKNQSQLYVTPTPTLSPASARPNRDSSSLGSTHTALWRRSMPSLLTLMPGHGDGINDHMKGTSPTAPVGVSSHDTFSSTMPRRSRYPILKFGNGSNHANVQLPYDKLSKKKVPSVQDLAIQPVQRVVRYVLLYKDLFNSTPETSPVRALAERALEGASRIARRCNRAQDNATFFL